MCQWLAVDIYLIALGLGKYGPLSQGFLLARNWSKRITGQNIPQNKPGEYPRISPK